MGDIGHSNLVPRFNRTPRPAVFPQNRGGPPRDEDKVLCLTVLAGNIDEDLDMREAKAKLGRNTCNRTHALIEIPFQRAAVMGCCRKDHCYPCHCGDGRHDNMSSYCPFFHHIPHCRFRPKHRADQYLVNYTKSTDQFDVPA